MGIVMRIMMRMKKWIMISGGYCGDDDDDEDIEDDGAYEDGEDIEDGEDSQITRL